MPKSQKTGTSRAKRAAKPRSAAQVPATPSHDDIATRAYELFLQRGAQHGQDFEDWLTAERELRP